MTRYATSGAEGQYQLGSNDQVLVNKLGVTEVGEMDDLELELLAQLYDEVFNRVTEDKQLTVADLKDWHSMWFGNVYEWAGDERSVNMSKADFTFAAANQVSRLLKEFESSYLAVYTPGVGYTEEQLAEAIAAVHVEFILIHPFREGNGRLSRLLANVMSLQAGWPELDFSLFDQHKDFYFKSIQAGVNGDLGHLRKLEERGQVFNLSSNHFSFPLLPIFNGLTNRCSTYTKGLAYFLKRVVAG